MTNKQRDELLLAMARMLVFENRPLHLSPMGQKSYDELHDLVQRIDKGRKSREGG